MSRGRKRERQPDNRKKLTLEQHALAVLANRRADVMEAALSEKAVRLLAKTDNDWMEVKTEPGRGPVVVWQDAGGDHLFLQSRPRYVAWISNMAVNARDDGWLELLARIPAGCFGGKTVSTLAAVVKAAGLQIMQPAGKTHPNAGILPQALAGGALKVVVREREAPHDDTLPGLLDDADWHDTDFLPLFDDGPRDSPIVRMPTLELLHGAGIPAGQPGKGAPGDLRLLYELLIDAPPEARDGGTARLEYSVDDLRRMLASPAPGARPLLNVAGERWGSFMRMLKRARSYTMPADGGASAWLPIAIRSYPQHPRGVLRLDVSLPPGSRKGPRILLKWLRRYGAASYPAWRTWLSLAYLWDRSAVNGRWVRGTQPRVARDAAGRMIGPDGRVLLDRRSQRVTRWSDPRAVLLDAGGRPVRNVAEAAREANPAAERLHPWLTRRDIESLGFPRPDRQITARARHKRFAAGMEVLQGFARDGTIVLVERCGRFQILPPAPDPDAESVPIRKGAGDRRR